MTNEKAIETLESLKEQHEWDPAVIDEDDVKALDMAIEALKDERPQGEWIMNKTSARGRNYTCTICKKVSRNKFDFCPNCGADMKEAEK